MVFYTDREFRQIEKPKNFESVYLELKMHIKVRNVNDAFRELVDLFSLKDEWNEAAHKCVVEEPSRGGRVLRINEPVTITYTYPRERVLFNSVRDANPFFHLYEALWMLAGRNDVAPVAYYASRMKEFSDDGKTLNGAYGYRWRHARGIDWTQQRPILRIDQLDLLVAHLKADPTSRRAVLQMWNVEDDLLKIGQMQSHTSKFKGYGLPGTPILGEMTIGNWEASKDVCCNLSVMFSLRNTDPTGLTTAGVVLDMTVTSRSEDTLWGLLGADYVDFSILQEYMAARLGAGVGLYHHFANNLHVYPERKDWRPQELLKEQDRTYDCFTSAPRLFPLVKDPVVFESELPNFVGAFNDGEEPWGCVAKWDEPFFQEVAGPMLTAFRRHKQGAKGEALAAADSVAAADWRIACQEWLRRRKKS